MARKIIKTRKTWSSQQLPNYDYSQEYSQNFNHNEKNECGQKVNFIDANSAGKNSGFIHTSLLEKFSLVTLKGGHENCDLKDSNSWGSWNKSKAISVGDTFIKWPTPHPRRAHYLRRGKTAGEGKHVRPGRHSPISPNLLIVSLSLYNLHCGGARIFSFFCPREKPYPPHYYC